MTKHKKMDYINISKSIFFSLAISFVGCASDGDKGIQTTNKEEVASSEEEKSQQTSDYNSYGVDTPERNESAFSSGSFEWSFATRVEDCAAPNGTYGLSFNLDSLYNNLNYDMPIHNFSYEELRVLRSIPYAKHGHWFKEGDLYEKFNNINEYINTIKPVVKKYAQDSIKEKKSEYWKLWKSDYPKTYSKIKLNAEEASFVKRVDNEIAERLKNRYVQKNGLKLLNLDLAENTNYLRVPCPNALDLLRKNNFCISETRAEQMYNPYEYYHGLPHYITTDLYLSAYNAYLAWQLQTVEENDIYPLICNFIKEMLDQSFKELNSCKDNSIRPLAEHAVVYYAIADKLATGSDNELPDNLRDIYEFEINAINSESDNESSLLKINMQYSLFKPRGFYTRNSNTQKYFKTMMWLQNAKYTIAKDENIIYPLFLSLQYERSNPSLKKKMAKVNNLLTFLIGEVDNCSMMDISSKLASNFGIKCDADLKDSNKLASVRAYLEKENSRCNRIFNRVDGGPVTEVNFMPQRYTPDAEVLMWMCDIAPESDRPFPDGLDVLTAFGNTVAENLLNNTDPGTKKWTDYASSSTKMKSKFKNYPDFNKTIYNKNIEALVSLQNKGTKPDYMKTEAWQMKNTNTALASWAELKHTTILYAEQPGGCEGGEGGDIINMPEPDWYSDIVEPNLEFWEKSIELINLTKKVFKENDVDSESSYKCNWLLEKAEKYLEITKKELAGEPFYENLVTGPEYEYFFNSLTFNDGSQISKTDIAKVADIYTRQILNAPDNGILHAGLGLVNSIYVLVENNGHIYLTEGAVYDYRLAVFGGRLNDDDWRKELNNDYNVGRQKWMDPYILKENDRVRIYQNIRNRTLRGWEFSNSEEDENEGWFF